MTASNQKMLISEGYDLEQPNEPVVGHCEECGCDLHPGEDVFDIFGTLICEECIHKFKRELREDY